MKWKVLVVEPDKRLNSLIEETFIKQGLLVYKAFELEEALTKITTKEIDLVICEGRLPGAKDFEFLKKLRQFTQIPVIILTNLALESQRIQGFEWGADDYMTKPFNFQELWLRSKRLFMYFYNISSFERIGQSYIFPFMALELTNHSLMIDHKEVKLTPREFQLLKFFVEHPEEIINRQRILKEVWGYEFCGEERTVDVHIQKLRKKLSRYSLVAGHSIVTVWKRGYRFTSQPVQGEADS